MSWVIWVERILSIVLRYVLPIVGGAMLLWWAGSSASAIQQGIQTAAPGIGAGIASLGMMFSLLPMFFMMMMFMSMMTMMIKVLE